MRVSRLTLSASNSTYRVAGVKVIVILLDLISTLLARSVRWIWYLILSWIIQIIEFVYDHRISRNLSRGDILANHT
jgi:hypothetical protein